MILNRYFFSTKKNLFNKIHFKENIFKEILSVYIYILVVENLLMIIPLITPFFG